MVNCPLGWGKGKEGKGALETGELRSEQDYLWMLPNSLISFFYAGAQICAHAQGEAALVQSRVGKPPPPTYKVLFILVSVQPVFLSEFLLNDLN